MTPATPTSAELTLQLREALRGRYNPREWVMAWEVGDGSGHRRRSCDLISMSLWESRGQEIVGHEIKACRSDWLREKADPAKAESFFPFCERWYLVAAAGVATAEELPEGWGLLELRGSRLRETVKAPRLQSRPLPRAMLSSIIRRLGKPTESEIEEQIRTETQRRSSYQEQHYKQQIEYLRQEYQATDQLIRDFQESSGIDLRGAIARDELGPYLRLASLLREEFAGRKAWVRQIMQQLENSQSSIEHLHHTLKETLERVEQEIEGD